ncbi:sugar nucleotide-binding protein [Mesonia sp. K4-1]|uniref:sugar nucleotide-binding protein n=1 Tax=Mesonia sp. K4-1 TaxID=2602760 RepID=UPI00351AAC9B
MLGGSGFLGQALYKELLPYFNTHGTYRTPHSTWDNNQQFHWWDGETESVSFLLESLQPDLIICALRGNFNAQIYAHFEAIEYVMKTDNKIIFLSSSNVFDAFSNYPSYEYDKTLSISVYGRFKIKIENALLRLPVKNYAIARIPMIYGANSPRLEELKTFHKIEESIEVFPNVVMNATSITRFTQQIHYIINHNLGGVFHLGSKDLIHHKDLVMEICKKIDLHDLTFKNVYDSNEDRFIAVLPKDNLLPDNLQFTVEDVVEDSIVFH